MFEKMKWRNNSRWIVSVFENNISFINRFCVCTGIEPWTRKRKTKEKSNGREPQFLKNFQNVFPHGMNDIWKKTNKTLEKR